MKGDTTEFKNKLADLATRVPIGSRYYHYKNPNRFYTVVAHGIIEATEEPAVSYQADYDDKIIWIRPLSVFLEPIEWEGKTVARFTRL